MRHLLRSLFGFGDKPQSMPRWVANPCKRLNRRTVLRLEELESRWCPAGGSQSVIWDPQPGTPNYNWSYGPNWANGVAPPAGVTACFEGSNNSPCNVDVNTSNPISLSGGYTATMTIQAGITMGITGYVDSNIGADNFVVAFAAPNAVENITAGQEVMGNFKWQAGGNVYVNGGNVTIGNGAGLNQSTASPMIINSGVVSIGPNSAAGSSTFLLTNGSANINVNPNGQLDFYMANQAANLVDNQGNGAEISNNGTTYLVGTAGGTTASIYVPFENHAELNADTGGGWFFVRSDPNGNDLSMDAGTIAMMGNVTLYCSHQYTQTGGTLEIADDQAENLYVQGGGLANFNGGKITFDSTQGYGLLQLYNVVFNGVEIDMRIDGTSNASDQISACLIGNTCTIKGNSVLKVTALNPVQKASGITWTLINPNNNKINGDFLAANIQLPNNVSESAGALPNSWQCNS